MPFIDFGPRIGDIPDALMARILACRPLVSLNRQEAEIAAERFGLRQNVEGLGAQWVKRFAAPLIVRHDKEGAWYFSAQSSDAYPPSRQRSLIRLAQVTATRAACWPGWRRVGRWRMPYCSATPWHRGWLDIAAVTARRFARSYSSHTKTYKSLRQ